MMKTFKNACFKSTYGNFFAYLHKSKLSKNHEKLSFFFNFERRSLSSKCRASKISTYYTAALSFEIRKKYRPNLSTQFFVSFFNHRYEYVTQQNWNPSDEFSQQISSQFQILNTLTKLSRALYIFYSRPGKKVPFQIQKEARIPTSPGTYSCNRIRDHDFVSDAPDTFHEINNRQNSTITSHQA